MPRWPLLLSTLLYTLGCAPRPSAGAPGPTVWVGREDYHSLLVVPADWVFPGAAGSAEVSFGDRAWMTGADRSCARASRIALWPTEGGFYLKEARPDATALAVPLSPLGAEALRAELAGWWERGLVIGTWDDGTVFTASRRGFHLFRSCNHQVAACLEAAGVPLPWHPWPWYTADAVQADVRAALATLEARGIRFVEPELSE